jgi:hypothetical protein
VIVCEPITVAVYVMPQRPAASRVQVPPPLNVPLSLVRITLPVGVVAPTPARSVTVAVQVAIPFTGTVLGAQLTLVLVDLSVAVTAVVPLLTV